MNFTNVEQMAYQSFRALHIKGIKDDLQPSQASGSTQSGPEDGYLARVWKFRLERQLQVDQAWRQGQPA